jgi:damage-control phosphatase, subfamily I
MKTYFDCISCFIRQAVESIQMVTDDSDLQEQMIRHVLQSASQVDLLQTPPHMVQAIHRIIREHTGQKDPYARVKKRFNDQALGMVPTLKKCIAGSAEPFETALRIAMAGNIIDFGVNGQLHTDVVEQTISEVLDAFLDQDAISHLRQQIDQCQNILYLADNTGEIVFDRLFIERLPTYKLTVAVRGAPILNDATLADAEYVGLTDIVDVIDNGSDAPGTLLDDCSLAFQERFLDADLIISKGQGNYETLSDVDANIFFVLKAKCPVAAHSVGCELGNWVIKHATAKYGSGIKA